MDNNIILYRISLLILVIFNVIICCQMLKQKSVLNNLAKINDDKGQRISQMETIIRNENLFYSTVNYSSIYKLINLPIFNNEVNNQIVSVIIPPYPCEICLDNQCDIFKSFVFGAAAAVHADLHLRIPSAGFLPFRAGELAALVRVDDFRHPVPCNRSLEHFYAVRRVQCVMQPPADNEAAVDIDDGRQIHKALLHRNICYVDAPDLIPMVHRQPPE
jgi:hypothetical protein